MFDFNTIHIHIISRMRQDILSIYSRIFFVEILYGVALFLVSMIFFVGIIICMFFEKDLCSSINFDASVLPF